MAYFDEEPEGYELIQGTGSISYLSDKPARRKKNPIGFRVQKQETDGTGNKESVGARKKRPA